MTLTEILTNPYYLRLSEQQQLFVKTLCENGNDPIAAAHAAWTCKSDESAGAMARKALAKPAIAKLVGAFFGEDNSERLTREDLLKGLARRARVADKDADAIKCFQLIAQIEGWVTKPSENDSDPPEVPGKDSTVIDLVMEIERKKRNERISKGA